jgi:hypothetical protein
MGHILQHLRQDLEKQVVLFLAHRCREDLTYLLQMPLLEVSQSKRL